MTLLATGRSRESKELGEGSLRSWVSSEKIVVLGHLGRPFLCLEALVFVGLQLSLEGSGCPCSSDTAWHGHFGSPVGG
jgi:hypothetical protein